VKTGNQKKTKSPVSSHMIQCIWERSGSRGCSCLLGSVCWDTW